MAKKNAADVRDFLNRLTNLKVSSKQPFKVTKDGPLYHIADADGLPIATFSEAIYRLFEEL